MAKIGRSTAAIQLLERVLATGQFDRIHLRRLLALTSGTLDAYLRGDLAMSLDSQLRLADLVIAKVPLLSRAGYRLREQVKAALSYESHATVTHPSPPPARFH